MQQIRGSQISMIFQDPMTSLNPTMKIGKQIVEGLVKNKKLSPSEAEKKAIDMLNLVSVPQPEKKGLSNILMNFQGGVCVRGL